MARNTIGGSDQRALEEQAARRDARFAERVRSLEMALARLDEREVVVSGFSLRCPVVAEGEWLCVVRAECADGRVVAFVSGPSFFALLEALAKKLEGDNLQWRADKYGNS